LVCSTSGPEGEGTPADCRWLRATGRWWRPRPPYLRGRPRWAAGRQGRPVAAAPRADTPLIIMGGKVESQPAVLKPAPLEIDVVKNSKSCVGGTGVRMGPESWLGHGGSSSARRPAHRSSEGKHRPGAGPSRSAAVDVGCGSGKATPPPAHIRRTDPCIRARIWSLGGGGLANG